MQEPGSPPQQEAEAIPGVLFEAALAAADLGVSIVDMRAPDQPLVWVNPAFCSITGYAAEQVLGRNCRFLRGDVDSEPSAATRAAIRAALHEGRPLVIELQNRRVDGTPFWNSLSLAPVRDASGEVTHFVGLMRDVSADRAAAAEHAATQGLYRALLAEEELVLNASDLAEMLQQSCERLSVDAAFDTAVILRAGQRGDLDVLAQAGRLRVEASRYRPNTLDPECAADIAVRAWNEMRAHFSNDYLAETAPTPYRERVRDAGMRAVGAIPVLRGGHRWALLGVGSSQTGVFTPGVVELLGRIARLIGHGMDAFDLRRRLQEEHRHISWLADHDALTGLLNRRGMRLRLQEAVADVDANGGCVAVAMLDFDDFKQINDNWGHASGDAVLRAVSARLVEAVRVGDTVARLGGDEIALVLTGLKDRSEIEPLLARVRQAVDAPLPLSGTDATVELRGSLGVAVYPEDPSGPEELLRHADQALVALKREPHGGSAPFWRLYRPSTDRDAYDHLKLVRDRFAAGGLRVFYQPIIEMSTGRVVEVEALARLDDGGGRLIPPLDFIHQLGREGVASLNAAVLRQAATDALRWQREDGIELDIAVNVDPALLATGEAFSAVHDVVGSLQFPPERIVLEILEHSDFLGFAAAQAALTELRAFGCRIALDDIGSAYSSLLRVKELPIDIVKLDQSFIRGLAERPQDLRFVQNLTQLARGLGVDFVAEGAETEDIVAALRALRVPMAQGYGIARPMPQEAFSAWLADLSSHPEPSTSGLLTCVAEQLVRLDMDVLIARHYPTPKPPLTLAGDPADGPVGRWLREAGFNGDQPLRHAYLELHAMFRDWIAAGPDADDSMVQSALEHLLRCAGEQMRATR